jgi:LEA14-like dessication related protein
MRRALPLLLAALLLPACTSYRSPELSVAQVRPGERSNEGMALVFTLDATNENDVALPLRDVQYHVDLDGKRVFSGTRSAEATLRRRGTQQITLPAVVNLATADPALRTAGRVPYRISGTLTYVTPGQIAEVLFDTGVRVPEVGFTSTGEVDLQPQQVISTPADPGPSGSPQPPTP